MLDDVRFECYEGPRWWVWRCNGNCWAYPYPTGRMTWHIGTRIKVGCEDTPEAS